MQNVTAGPPEPKRRTIGQEVAQRCDPSAVRRVKFGILQNGVVRFLGFLEFTVFLRNSLNALIYPIPLQH